MITFTGPGLCQRPAITPFADTMPMPANSSWTSLSTIMARPPTGRVWNQHLGNLAPDYLHRDIVIHTTRHRTEARIDGYKDELDHLFAPFPDARVDIYDVAFNEDPFHGTRVSIVWVLNGTYSGIPLYGPVTNTPVEIFGVSHFKFRGDKIYREWRIYDEMALLAQIKQAQGDINL